MIIRTLSFYFGLIILQIIFCGSVIGQAISTQPSLLNVIPPSPTAAALGKYGEIPVSLYTGVPSISIPLYELQEGEIQLPISLSYHASGIKVEEIASNVGLGWSLNAGGVITRTVRGLPDESDVGYFSASVQRKLDDYLKNGMSSMQEVEFHASASEGLIDTEPDVFYINFMGYSGKLVIDGQGNAFIPSNKELQVKVEDLTSLHFEVIDGRGTKYIFSSEETSEIESFCGNGSKSRYVSSWYLSQILYKGGQSVYFEYGGSIVQYPMTHSETKYKNATINQYCTNPATSRCSSIHTVDAMYLLSISTTNSKILFTHSFDRKDLLNSARLDKIELLKTNSPTTIIKTIELSYDYYLDHHQTAIALRLTSVREKNLAGISHLPYLFDYNAEPIPSRQSKAQDHWGYYNGKYSNTSLIPSVEVMIANQKVQLVGADRAVNPEVITNGILQKITYPTKGSTEFIFEPHSYGFSKDQPIDYIDTTYAHHLSISITKYDAVPVDIGLEKRDNFTLVSDGVIKIISTRIAQLDEILPNGEASTRVYILNALGDIIYECALGEKKIHIMSLPSGNYTLVSYVKNWGDTAEGAVSYHSVLRNMKHSIAGGLRVKAIKDDDGLGNVKIKNYQYMMSNETDRVSGVLVRQPSYVSMTGGEVNAGGNAIVDCMFYTITANSQATLFAAGGYAVSYREVHVSHTSNHENTGKTTYCFTSAYEFPDMGGDNFPFVLIFNNEVKRGKLVKEIAYQFKNNSYVLVFEKNNEYSYIPNEKNTKGCKISLLYRGASYIPSKYSVIFYNTGFDYHISDVIETQKTYSTTDGLSALATRSKLAYNLSHSQIAQQTAKDSKGRVVHTYTRYVSDYIICSNNCEDNYTIAFNNCYAPFFACLAPKKAVCMDNITSCREAKTNECYGGTCCPVFNCQLPQLNCDETLKKCRDDAAGLCASEYDYCLHQAYVQCQPAKNQCQDAAFAQYKTCQTAYKNSLVLARNTAITQGQFQTAAILQMQINHQITVPIEQWSTVTGEDGIERVSSALLYEYRIHPENSSLVVPTGIKVLELDEPLANFIPSKVENLAFIANTNYTQRVAFTSYDSRGNLLQQRKTGDVPTSYVWGYNQTLPVAQVVNAASNEVFYTSFETESLVGIQGGTTANPAKTGEKYFTGSYQPTFTIPNNKKYVISYFREVSAGTWQYIKEDYTPNYTIPSGSIDEVRIYPADAVMSTMTYTPLIGKTSATDANGITTYYEYDSFNRLYLIRDDKRNIVQQIDYKYYND